MDRRIILPLGGLLCLMVVFSVPLKASCPATTLETQFSDSMAVFVGRAIAQQVVSATGGPGERVTETTFEVEDRWKGVAETTVRVQTCGWTVGNDSVTSSGDFWFAIGEKYVVFAVGQPLATGSCLPNARVDRAERILQWLSGRPRN
jgi:hypothetical protein